MLAFSVVKLKLEYPLALHQNLPKKARQTLVPILSAASLIGVRGLRDGVASWKQEVGAVFSISTISWIATDLHRRGAGACLGFGSRASLRGCARCSRARSTAVERVTQKEPVSRGLGSRFSPNCDKLNRQTREFRNAVTYRKQTIANHSNRQNSQFCPTVFLAPFQSDAGSALPLRIPRA